MFEWMERGPIALSQTGSRQAFMLITELYRDGEPLPAIGDCPAIISRGFYGDLEKTRKEIERDKPLVEARYA
jgi:hypothetical protein